MRENFVHLGADPAAKQSQVLDYVLQNKIDKEKEPTVRVSIADARRGESQVELVTNRTTTRILFISQDATLLNQATKSLDGYLNVADMFNEVHIVVLQPGIRTKHPVLRVSENVWVYVASAKNSWSTLQVALKIISENLVFAGGFRPDLIVARDSYESALVAYLVARKYQRPTQLHVLDDFGLSGKVEAPRSFFWRHLSGWLVSTFKSIRTTTETQAAALALKYPHTTDILELPKFQNFFSTGQDAPAVSMKDIYRDFTFIILYVGPLSVGRNAYQTIDAVRPLLQNSRVGLVILGDGTARAEAMKRVELLGMSKQVVFEKRIELLDDYIASADVVLVPETDVVSDNVVIQTAVSGRPLVLASSANRNDLFREGVSALFFAHGNVPEATTQLKRVLNDIALRKTLSTAVSEVALLRLNDDPAVYQQLYRDSIERALFTDGDYDDEEVDLPPAE